MVRILVHFGLLESSEIMSASRNKCDINISSGDPFFYPFIKKVLKGVTYNQFQSRTLDELKMDITNHEQCITKWIFCESPTNSIIK